MVKRIGRRYSNQRLSLLFRSVQPSILILLPDGHHGSLVLTIWWQIGFGPVHQFKDGVTVAVLGQQRV